MDLFPASPRNVRPRRVDNSPDPVPPAGGWAEWYLRDEDDVGESTEQCLIVRELLSALIELAAERGWTRTLVAGDQFFAWIPDEPLVRISPDVYLLEHSPDLPAEHFPAPTAQSLFAPPERHPAMWHTWLPGQVAPRFAVEVVSEDWAKDYVHAPRKYAQLGTRELVVFDPDWDRRNRRVALQLFRRDGAGHLVRVAAGAAPVHSEELGAWLVVIPHPGGARLRIARDAAGRDLVPTTAERAQALATANATLVARAEAETARAEAEAARADALAAHARSEAARADARAARLHDQSARIAELTAALAARERTR